MAPVNSDCYDTLAEYYHLIFDDWDKSIERQAAVLNPLIVKQTGRSSVNLLDCACGIGTQAIGFAQAGHRVVASDLSRAAVARAEREARQRHLDISFFVSDMTSLEEIADGGFTVVAALDNALPHLPASQILQAVRTMGSKLEPRGLFMASIGTTTISSFNDRRFRDLLSTASEGRGGSFTRFGTGSMTRNTRFTFTSRRNPARNGLRIILQLDIAVCCARNSRLH